MDKPHKTGPTEKKKIDQDSQGEFKYAYRVGIFTQRPKSVEGPESNNGYDTVYTQ